MISVAWQYSCEAAAAHPPECAQVAGAQFRELASIDGSDWTDVSLRKVKFHLNHQTRGWRGMSPLAMLPPKPSAGGRAAAGGKGAAHGSM